MGLVLFTGLILKFRYGKNKNNHKYDSHYRDIPPHKCKMQYIISSYNIKAENRTSKLKIQNKYEDTKYLYNAGKKLF